MHISLPLMVNNIEQFGGEVQILPDTFLGVQTNRNSSNWFAKVGSEEQHVILAGCQIHYAVKVDECPNLQDVQERVGENDELKTLDSRIYVPVEADIPEPPCVRNYTDFKS